MSDWRRVAIALDAARDAMPAFRESVDRVFRPTVTHIRYIAERYSYEPQPRKYRRTKRGLVPIATQAERDWQSVFSARSRSRHKVQRSRGYPEEGRKQ